MRRRSLVTLLGLALAGIPLDARAQRRRRIGYLAAGMRRISADHTIDVLRESLARHGWRDGETIEIVERWSDGDAAILPQLARELVAGGAEVLVATGTTETRALQAATKTVPIVFMQIGVDPVTTGLVERIARPGGNITGFLQGPQFLWSKRVELLADLLGRSSSHRLGWLGNPGNVGSEPAWRDAHDAVVRAGGTVTRFDVRSPADIDAAFARMDGLDALLVQYDFLLAVENRRVAEHAIGKRLPAIYENRMQVLGGGLVSYGGDLRENFRQGAGYVHRILNGANPATMPVIQASRFELVLNLKTARTMGIDVPSSVLLRADELIE